MYTLVNARNYQVLGIGRSTALDLRDYQIALINYGRSLDVDNLVQHRKIEAVVKGIAFKEGFYYFLLEDYQGKEFYASSALSPELKWTQVGHSIIIEVQEGGG